MDKPNNNGHLQLTGLPVEILRIILSHSVDIISLDSTVHSCGTLFHAFYAFPAPIITAVIHREIGKDLLFEAVRFARALDFSRSRHRATVVANAAFAEFLRRDQESPHQLRWTLPGACFVTHLDRIVKSSSLRIESEILARIQSIHPHMEMRPASSTELPRIQRALYRFETYRFLFPARRDYDFDYSDDDSDNINVLDDEMKAQMLFLAASPPWENEQLGCIHESLWRLVAPAYNDLALHSIEWEGRRRPARDYGDACIEYLLSGGLKEIHEISLCNTWAKRYDLLGYDQPHRPVRDFRGFLRKTFDYYEGYCLIKYPPTTGAHKDTHYPVGQDTTEQGSQRTWDWLIERWPEQPNFEARKRVAVVIETTRLRACGYVF
ncbi:hypothetical protein CKAH01_10569 [Colletotrichum kahawae]|uniref:Uncharacterized protein n=1 Tax=Colletotrichum kahawae TaxID=34407 RepID=A0AAD9XYP3_COLKA|nr:hypothetical protein CKAH01_10569 [Colletotrichum kahawae]